MSVAIYMDLDAPDRVLIGGPSPKTSQRSGR